MFSRVLASNRVQRVSIGADPSVGRAMAASGINQNGEHAEMKHSDIKSKVRSVAFGLHQSVENLPTKVDHNGHTEINTSSFSKTTNENQKVRKSAKNLVASGQSQKSELNRPKVRLSKTNIVLDKLKSWKTIKETSSDEYLDQYDELNNVKSNLEADDVYKQIKLSLGII